MSAYLQTLQNDPERFQFAIETLLEKHQAQPVGNGYIDLILKKENSLNLISELTNLSVAVYSLTWWCHFTLETASLLGCPHGYGGPQDKYGEGMFSECVHYPAFDVFELPEPIHENSMTPELFVEKCNALAINYIQNILPTERFYSPCLYPGLWLRVPDDWKRKYYWAKG
jgi:hypothetical protein